MSYLLCMGVCKFSKVIPLFLVFFISLGAFSQTNPLNGAWVPVRLEINGSDLPSGTFEKQKLILNDSNYTYIAESVGKGVVKYTNDKLDIYGKDGVNMGKHFTALYKYENELLTICYNLAGDVYPESYDTKGKPTFFLAVFKKEEAK